MKTITRVAYFSVNTQFENIGDALIVRELAALISTSYDLYVDYSRCPPSFRETADLDKYAQPTANKTFRGFVAIVLLQRLKGRSVSLFLNPGGLGRHQLTSKALLSARIYNVVLLFLRALGIQIHLLGVSLDELNSKNLSMFRARKRALKTLAVRDSRSLEYARSKLGGQVELMPDLSFNLYSSKPPKYVSERKFVAVSFRVDGLDNLKIREAIDWIIDRHSRGTTFLFVSQVERDAGGMEQLATYATMRGATVERYHNTTDIADLSTKYRSCKYLYSNRLHALLLALYAGVTPVAVVDDGLDQKIISMWRDLGWDLNFIRLGELGPILPTEASDLFGSCSAEFTRLRSRFNYFTA